MFVLIRPADPLLASAMQLRVHDSLVSGIELELGVGIAEAGCDRLTDYAQSCASSGTQRAAFARALANLTLFGEGLTVEPLESRRRRTRHDPPT